MCIAHNILCGIPSNAISCQVLYRTVHMPYPREWLATHSAMVLHTVLASSYHGLPQVNPLGGCHWLLFSMVHLGSVARDQRVWQCARGSCSSRCPAAASHWCICGSTTGGSLCIATSARGWLRIHRTRRTTRSRLGLPAMTAWCLARLAQWLSASSMGSVQQLQWCPLGALFSMAEAVWHLPLDHCAMLDNLVC